MWTGRRRTGARLIHFILFLLAQVFESALVDANGPKTYMEAILRVHRTYDALVKVAFNGDQGFKKALEKACIAFANKNALTEKAGTQKSPELIARYCDMIMKKSPKNPQDAEMDELVVQIVSNANLQFACLRFYRSPCSSTSRTRTCSRSSIRSSTPSDW